MKTRKNYVMTKSNLTLTQSGLLAVLLQRQRHKVIELAQRCPDGRQVRPPFWSSLTRRWGDSWHDRSSTIPPSLLWEPFHATLEPFIKANCHVLPNPYLQRAPATDSLRSAEPTSRMGRAKWKIP